VARHLRGGVDEAAPVVAKEAEFLLNGHDTGVTERVPELFFCRDMQGYGWCVRKGDYLNVGIGRRDSRGFATHVRDFVSFLEQNRIVTDVSTPRWRGHAYLASGTGARTLVVDGALLVGDAAGLAYPESGEGIKPAIASGRLAAETLIGARGRHTAEDLAPYANTLRTMHPPVPERPAPMRAVTAAMGRLLLGSTTFTRRVVLDRWFLRAAGST